MQNLATKADDEYQNPTDNPVSTVVEEITSSSSDSTEKSTNESDTANETINHTKQDVPVEVKEDAIDQVETYEKSITTEQISPELPIYNQKQPQSESILNENKEETDVNLDISTETLLVSSESKVEETQQVTPEKINDQSESTINNEIDQNQQATSMTNAPIELTNQPVDENHTDKHDLNDNYKDESIGRSLTSKEESKDESYTANYRTDDSQKTSVPAKYEEKSDYENSEYDDHENIYKNEKNNKLIKRPIVSVGSNKHKLFMKNFNKKYQEDVSHNNDYDSKYENQINSKNVVKQQKTKYQTKTKHIKNKKKPQSKKSKKL